MRMKCKECGGEVKLSHAFRKGHTEVIVNLFQCLRCNRQVEELTGLPDNEKWM